MKPNKLVNESSPYLAGHAFNPVDWHPWTEEAFALAASGNKPVLLSIGYSACHWCHVMEKESFMDEETARVMNENFVCVKVDREERPDIDSVYQKLGQAAGGGGGWPLTVFMTPEKAPFYIGSYFPPEGRFGLPGFKDLCARLGAFYRASPEKAAEAARGVVSALRGIEKESSAGREEVPADASAVEAAARSLKALYDSRFGGFGQAPKFPCVNILEFFMMISRGDPEAAGMVSNTLRKMARGGIHDRLGGGFHRYSTDSEWRVPHYEKMLYDNALLARVYTFAHRMRPEEIFKETAEKTLSFMNREMLGPAGGFYSSIDADSCGEEGKFYLWTMDELKRVLGEDEARAAAEYLGVAPDGAKKEISRGGKENILSGALAALLKERDKREPPFMDKKIIAAWNGMAVSAFARAGAAFGNASFVETAKGAAEFVKNNLSFSDGRLRRSFKDSPGGIPGFIDDYAYMAEGFFDLYMADFSEEYLWEAVRLTETAHKLFWNGAGYNYSEEEILSEMIYSLSGFSDASFPSGASVLVYNILRLGGVLDEEIFKSAGNVLAGSGSVIREEPFGSAAIAKALAYHIGGGVEAVISGSMDDENTRQMLSFLKKSAMPYLAVFLQAPESSIKHPRGASEEEMPSARICGNFRCFPPVSGADGLEEIFKNLNFWLSEK